MSFITRARPYIVLALIWGLVWSAAGSIAWWALKPILTLTYPISETLLHVAGGYAFIGAVFGLSIATAVKQHGQQTGTVPSIRRGGALGATSAFGAVYCFADLAGKLLAGPQSILFYLILAFIGVLLGGASGAATFAIVHRSGAKSVPLHPIDTGQIGP